jgi:hypothetical protein
LRVDFARLYNLKIDNTATTVESTCIIVTYED